MISPRARPLGVEPKIVHVPSEWIARFDPDTGAGLLGDKQYSAIFDNTKIKRCVPGYQATITFAAGMRRSVRWIEQNPDRKQVVESINDLTDMLIAAMQRVNP